MMRRIHMTRSNVGQVCMCATFLFMASCGTPENAAKIDFSRTYSCPDEDITIRPSSGPSLVELQRQNLEKKVPADIAADPKRKKVWLKDHAVDDVTLKRFRVFEREGCGHSDKKACMCPDIPVKQILCSCVPYELLAW